MSEVDAALEAVHHACLAGDFDPAAAILYRHVYRGPAAVLTRELGRYETALEALLSFFPFRDISYEPRVGDPQARRWLLHETAACLHQLGRLSDAARLGARAAAAAERANDDHAAAVSLHNLAETYLAAGSTGACEDSARQALALAVRAGEGEDELVACTLLGAVLDLRAQLPEADELFRTALRIAEETTSVPILYSLSGVRYAAHLALMGHADDAAEVAGANRDFCREQRWFSDLALATSQTATWRAGEVTDALEVSRRAVRVARTAGNPQVLSEVLLEHGRMLIRAGVHRDAQQFLEEARDLAVEYGYKTLVCRVRLALAQVRLVADDASGAEAEVVLADGLIEALGLAALRPEADRVRETVRARGQLGSGSGSADEGSTGPGWSSE